MNRDPIEQAVHEGEQRALREWQVEHREPCGDCAWEELRSYSGDVVGVRLDACAKHGGER